MSRLKDKAIKWLGGFTEEEYGTLKMKCLFQKPYFVQKQLNTVKLCSEYRLKIYEKVPENQLLCILAEGLAEELKDHISIEVVTDGQERFYRGEVEVIVRA